MPETAEATKGPEREYKTDPFAFVFRELDIVHREIIELKSDLKEINKRIDDTNKRIDDLSKEMNRRFDTLYVFVIATLIGTLGTLIKLLFF